MKLRIGMRITCLFNRELFMSNILTIIVKSISIRLSSPECVVEQIIGSSLYLAKVIPLLSISQENNPEFDHEIVIVKSGRYNLILDELKTEYSYSSAAFDLSSFAYTILVPIVSFLLVRKGLLFIHCSAFSKNNTGLIISGKGKSTTVLNLCRNYGYRLIAEDNLLLDPKDKHLYSSCRTISLDARLLKSEKRGKISCQVEKLGLSSLDTAVLDKLFCLTTPYKCEQLSVVHDFEKAFFVGSFVNERFINSSRWNSHLEMQFPLLYSKSDYSFRDSVITQLLAEIPVLKVESRIENAHAIIHKYLMQ